MNLLPQKTSSIPATASRLMWNAPSTSLISTVENWSRASRYQCHELRDEQGNRYPLLRELWLTVSPARQGDTWRAESDLVGRAIVGRAATAEAAVRDWQKRFRRMVQRFLTMRPFEFTSEDRQVWSRIQSVVDVPRYRISKPITLRQVGKVLKQRTGYAVVEWAEGVRERVRPQVFDEVFSRFKVGQPFEATVTRHPMTFRLLRAEAVRRLSGTSGGKPSTDSLWDRVAGSVQTTAEPASQVDEEFWLGKRG